MNEATREDKPAGKLNVWLPFLFALTAVGSMLIGFELQRSTPVPVESSSVAPFTGKTEVGKIEEMLRFIEAKYVDEPNREELMEAAIRSMLNELDPHSNYIPKEQLQAVNESLEGSFDGVGISFYIIHDTLFVVSCVIDGPSDKAGVKAGDRIVEIQDTSVAGIGITEKDVMARLRGERGSKVQLTVKRRGENDLLNFEITRGQIPDKSLDAYYMVDKQTAYIKISRFSNSTYEEFMKAMETLHDEGMVNLIIDVRRNSGGYLSAVTKIVDQLFDTGRKLIVYTEGRSQRRNESKSSGRNFFTVGQLVILVDEGSASASEILAGAVQDWDRGTIVGRRTFGKGLVQEQYKLSDGSALRLTVARYYTPSGRSIQKPYNNGHMEYDEEALNRLASGELLTPDSIKVEDSTEYQTASGRIVYGGGGIYPDVFVPVDSIINNRFYVQTVGLVPEFVAWYLDAKGGLKQPFENIRDFIKRFDVPEMWLKDFLKYAKEKGVEGTGQNIAESREHLRLRMKAFIARSYFDDSGMYEVLNLTDPVFIQAMSEIKKEGK